MFEFEYICHCLVYDGRARHRNCTWTWLLFNYNDNNIRLCTDVNVDRMHGTVLYRLCANRQYVLVHVWIWIRRCLVYDVPWMTRSQLYTRLLFNYNDDGKWPRADVDIHWLWNGPVSVLNEQDVRWYWCMFICKCVISKYTFRHDTITNKYSLGCYSTTMTYGKWLRADVNLDWYGTVLRWIWTNSEYVGIDACLNLNLSLLYTIHYDATAIALSHAIELQWQYHTALRWCLNVYNVGFGWTGSTLLVLTHVYIWMCHYLTSWYHRNCTLYCYWTTIPMAYGSALNMERYRVGFGRTESTLVVVHVWIWICHCSAYDAHRNWTCNYNDNDVRLCADVDWIWNGVMMAVDEQEVRWYWCMFQFEYAIVSYTMHHETIASTHSLLCIQIQL